MSNILKTVEDVKKDVLYILQENNWKELICTTPKGTYVNPYLEEHVVVISAKLAPTGIFASEELCDQLLKQTIIENIDNIAKFVIKKVPMTIFTNEHKENIGLVVQVASENEITKTPTHKTALFISKHNESKAGFYVSMFTPIL